MRLPLCVASVILPATLFASEAKGPNRTFQATPSGVSTVSQLLDAAALAKSGQPDSLIAAARLAAETGATPGSRSRKTEGGAQLSAEKPLVLEAPSLLAAASTAAKAAKLDELAFHADALKAKGLPAGKRGKVFHQTERVGAGATDVYEISFKGGEPAQVGITGLDDADLDLKVFDEMWNEICSSASDSHREYCSWIPATTGPFRVRVRNTGKTPSDYVLVTN